MAVDLIPRDPKAELRTRRALDRLASIVNDLLRDGVIVQDSGGWIINPGTPALRGRRIPGLEGDEGPQGIPGPRGRTGATGATGPAGPSGSGGLAIPPQFDGEDAPPWVTPGGVRSLRPPGGTTRFLRSDGNWAVPAGGGSGVTTEEYVRRAPHYPPFTPSGQDDEFDDDSFSGWTTVEDATGPTLTLTESHDILSVSHPGGDPASDLHAWVKAATIDAGDYVECCCLGSGVRQNFASMGVIMANGDTWGAGTQNALWTSISQQIWGYGTYTNYNTQASHSSSNGPGHHTGNVFLRLVYEGSNNWSGLTSPDGISWVTVTGGTFARTLTPTHWGFFVTTNSGTLPFVFSYRYVRFSNP